MRHLVWIAKVLRRKLVLTVAGGEYADVLHPRGLDLVVYSEELRRQYLENGRCTPADTHCIAERIDSTVYRETPLSQEDREALGAPRDGRLAFAAIRIDTTKRPWLDGLLQSARALDERGEAWTFVVAGDGDLLEEMRATPVRPDRESSTVTLDWVGPVTDAARLVQWLNAADVVIGNGRSLMEAISCGTPTIILGENGEAEALTPENLEPVMVYNFSGRHFRYRDEAPGTLAEVFRTLAPRTGSGPEGRDAASTIPAGLLDHRVGAKKLEDLYRTMTVFKMSVVDCVRWQRARRKAYRQRRLLAG